ncbi:hypothetical protein HXX76_000281 [Chlamydomonas incerta]|uniref:DEK-C domain-containing protein n=1 Tax=Chlamydomonas incerta TaxID=51695 RepID=A0A836B2Q3_CHLIN|nr:hypothetical protein HXX76_000281 [Chlamydomonas incerta]|eukprot:KAG2445673.1 hypothetical protein HXX76_000281 [Chlamydomonas incerta]
MNLGNLYPWLDASELTAMERALRDALARHRDDDDEEEVAEEEEPYEEVAPAGGLPSPDAVERATLEILRESDVTTTTLRQVMETLRARFGVDLADMKPLIRGICLNYARDNAREDTGPSSDSGGGGGGGATGAAAAKAAGAAGAGGKGAEPRALDEQGWRRSTGCWRRCGPRPPPARCRARSSPPAACRCFAASSHATGRRTATSTAEVDVVAALRPPEPPAASGSSTGAAGGSKGGKAAGKGKAGKDAGAASAGAGAPAAAAPPPFNSLQHHSMRRVAAGAVAELSHWEEAAAAMMKCGFFERLPRMLNDLAAQYRYGQPYGSHYGRGRATDQAQYILPRLVYAAAQAAALSGAGVRSALGARLLPELLAHYPIVHPQKTIKARARRRLQHSAVSGAAADGGSASGSGSGATSSNASGGLGGFPSSSSSAPPAPGSSAGAGGGAAAAAGAVVAPLLQGACSDPEVEFSDAEGYDEPLGPAAPAALLPVAARRRRRHARKAVNAPGGGAAGSSSSAAGAAGAAAALDGVPQLQFEDEDAPCPADKWKGPRGPELGSTKNLGGLGRNARSQDPDPMAAAFVLLLSQVWDWLDPGARRRHLERDGVLAAVQALPGGGAQADLHGRVLQSAMRSEYQQYAPSALPQVAAADRGLREAAARLRLAGNERFKAADYGAALESYTHAVALDWDEPAHRNNRGGGGGRGQQQQQVGAGVGGGGSRCFALTKLGRLGEARAEALQAVECDPRLARSWVRLGGVFEALRQPQCAQLCYRQALELQAPRPDAEPGAKLREVEAQLGGKQPWSFRSLPRRWVVDNAWRNFLKQNLTPEQFKALKHETANTAGEMEQLMRAMGFPMTGGEDPDGGGGGGEEGDGLEPVREAARASEAYQATAKLVPLWESACAVEEARRAPAAGFCNWNLSWSDVALRDGATGLVCFMITVVDSGRGEQRVGGKMVYGKPRLPAVRNALYTAIARPLMGKPARPDVVFLAHRAVPYLAQLQALFQPLGVQLLAESRAEAEQSAALHCTHFMGYNQRDSYVTEKPDAYGLPAPAATAAAAAPAPPPVPPPPCATDDLWPPHECAYPNREEGEAAAAEYRLLLAELAAGGSSSSGAAAAAVAAGAGAGGRRGGVGQLPPTDAELKEAVRALIEVSDVDSLEAEDLLRPLRARFGAAALDGPRAAGLVRKLLAEAAAQHATRRRQQLQQQRGGARQQEGGAGGRRGIRAR